MRPGLRFVIRPDGQVFQHRSTVLLRISFCISSLFRSLLASCHSLFSHSSSFSLSLSLSPHPLDMYIYIHIHLSFSLPPSLPFYLLSLCFNFYLFVFVAPRQFFLRDTLAAPVVAASDAMPAVPVLIYTPYVCARRFFLQFLEICKKLVGHPSGSTVCHILFAVARFAGKPLAERLMNPQSIKKRFTLHFPGIRPVWNAGIKKSTRMRDRIQFFEQCPFCLDLILLIIFEYSVCNV